MDNSIAEDYKSSLNDLNFNSKPLINMLTMLAEENKRNAAAIVKTIVDHVNEVSKFTYFAVHVSLIILFSWRESV